jgi:hypothetical protein
MNSLNDFLSKRDESDLFISIEEVSEYCKNLESEEKRVFLILLRGHLKKILGGNFPSYDSRLFYEASYSDIFDWMKNEVEKLEEQIVEQKASIPDENKSSVDFSRKETALLAHYWRKYRFIKKLDNRPLGKQLNKLTDHSEGNIRRDLSKNNLEIIIEEIDREILIKMLESIITDLKNKSL